jgi:hypothetical protein
MTAREPSAVKNLDPASEALPWSRARDALDQGLRSTDVTTFLATTDPDGRSHSAGVGAAFHDGDLYFQSSPKARKARNVAANRACSMGARLPGIDVVVEGEAERVVDRPTLEAVVRVWNEGGWPAVVEGNAINAPFNAPSAGPPPWYVYRLRPRQVYGVASEEPFGATRWTFET